MKIALFAAGSLFVANVFSVLMVQAEARGRAVIAGLTEMAFWIANIIAIRYAVDSFNLSLVIACLLSCFLSTYIATYLGHQNIESEIDSEQDSALEALDARVRALEGDSRGV